ncbi:transposable element Tcb2 transposase [Trichonephila clavipes]|nr:transposable element Tcb2 transposase [Trichonephila clavipes]
MILDYDYLTSTGGREYGVRLLKLWILHAKLELSRPWWLNDGQGYFFVAPFKIFGVCTKLPQCNLKDNCTSHESRLATGWLDEYSSDISVINWPPRSPDLNPIDNLWDVLEQDVKGNHTAPTYLTELWTALANIWQVIPIEHFKKLVESMPRHMAVVIKARKGPTRYLFHAEIVEVEIEVVSPSIVPSGNFAELKSHCHLYGAQGQRQ